MFRILEPDEQPGVKRHSSINQHRNKLSVLKGNEWTPIAFDNLDYIDCDGIHSTITIITDDEGDLGYTYGVANKNCLRVGLDYATADETLEPEED